MGQGQSDSSAAELPGYYDILLLGKTGKGKSTTGNKLLGLYSYGTRRLQIWKSNVELPPENERDVEDDLPFFRQAEKGRVDSMTRRCKVISNEETKIRVLDTPGFADSQVVARLGAGVDLYQANLQGMRWIVRRQQEHELAFSRILYFLPERGPLERADRALQEEIKVMAYFFGDSIFYNMVIIATMHSRYSIKSLHKADVQHTQKAFLHAMKLVLEQELPDIVDRDHELKCPPVVYISLKDTPAQILEKVKSAKVEGKSRPIIRSEQNQPPSEASATPPVPEATASALGASTVPLQLTFRQDICVKCAVRIVTLPNDQRVVRRGEELGDNNISYETSRCHPEFYFKYSSAQRVLGGFAHIATLGLGLLIGDVILGTGSWPGFTNADEICPNCANPPGSPGCAPVLQACAVQLRDGGTVPFACVDHSNTMP